MHSEDLGVMVAVMQGYDARDKIYVNANLLSYLETVNLMAERAGGKLMSRQVIAHGIMTWQALNTDESIMCF